MILCLLLLLIAALFAVRAGSLQSPSSLTAIVSAGLDFLRSVTPACFFNAYHALARMMASSVHTQAARESSAGFGAGFGLPAGALAALIAAATMYAIAASNNCR